MVEFKEACEIATKFFLENDYASIDEAKDASDKWLFHLNVKKHAMECHIYVCPKTEMNHICSILRGWIIYLCGRMLKLFQYKG